MLVDLNSKWGRRIKEHVHVFEFDLPFIGQAFIPETVLTPGEAMYSALVAGIDDLPEPLKLGDGHRVGDILEGWFSVEFGIEEAQALSDSECGSAFIASA